MNAITMLFFSALIGVDTNLYLETKSIHSFSPDIEKQCLEVADQGVFRPPWFQDQATIDFETLGCCYNDGLKEPSGC